MIDRILSLAPEGGRFVTVGLVNTAVSYAVFHLCYIRWQLATLLLNISGTFGDTIEAHLSNLGISSFDAAFATAMGYAVGLLNSYILNSIWTFRTGRLSASSFPRFLALNVAGLGFTSFLMFYFVDVRHYNYLATWIIVMGLMTILNYLGCKYWVFVSDSPQD